MPAVILSSGLRVHCEIADTTDPWRTAETMLLHHGLGKTGRYWLPWSRVLSRYFRVVTIDMLGNGQSSRPRGHRWSIAGYARDAVEVLDALGLRKVHFVGEGLGGCVGLQLGARHGARVASLTLCATPYRPSEGASADLAARSQAIARGGLADFVDTTLPSRMDWSRFPQAAYAWYREQRLRTSPRIMSEQMAAQDGVDLEWALPLIAAPTLLIVPGDSPSGADLQMKTMSRAIRGARIAAFPHERQWVTFSAADDCVAATLRFLADVTGDRTLAADRVSRA